MFIGFIFWTPDSLCSTPQKNLRLLLCKAQKLRSYTDKVVKAGICLEFANQSQSLPPAAPYSSGTPSVVMEVILEIRKTIISISSTDLFFCPITESETSEANYVFLKMQSGCRKTVFSDTVSQFLKSRKTSIQMNSFLSFKAYLEILIFCNTHLKLNCWLRLCWSVVLCCYSCLLSVFISWLLLHVQAGSSLAQRLLLPFFSVWTGTSTLNLSAKLIERINREDSFPLFMNGWSLHDMLMFIVHR